MNGDEMGQNAGAWTSGKLTGAVLAAVIGIGAGVAIGVTDGGISWTRDAAAALLLVTAGCGLGAVFGSMPAPAHQATFRVRVDREPKSAAAPVGEAELATLRRELAAARDELGALHSSLSHGLRSPIGAVINFAAVLDEDYGTVLGPDGRSLLGSIGRSARSALALADGLGRLTAVGRHELDLQPVDTEDLVRASFAEMAPTNRVLDFRVVGPLPAVVADAELLRAAFDQLLANAVRFTAKREKANVSVGGRREADSVVYWVEDNGAGFPPRYADKLFRPFERLHRQDEFPGVGVGLAIVRRVAERHGGSIEADAEPDRGARFELRLPAEPEATS
jgi:light-regulated signal transduction histidine kinase (bacteriophytochrome)